MKVYIRTLWGDSVRRSWWSNDHQKEALRNYLNDIGFHVLSGPGDSLEVYAVDYSEPLDILAMKKILEISRKSWYALRGGKTK